jgi:hypothetical protein
MRLKEMKRRLLFTLFGLVVMLGAVLQLKALSYDVLGKQDGDLPEREEIDQTYQLRKGAEVDVSGINGRVEIQTSDTTSAEVHIVRSAKRREDLAYHKIIIEQSEARLVVRGEHKRDIDEEHKVRQRVLLKLPRRVELKVSGVNGPVKVTPLDGSSQISGVNGRVEITQTKGYVNASGINGSISITLAQLGERGSKVSGINGKVELRFQQSVNADLKISGINGQINTELNNLTLLSKGRSHFQARIGNGGVPISISGINGSVQLTQSSS